TFDKTKVDVEKQDLAVYWFNDGKEQWSQLENSEVDFAAGKISGETNHFTRFAVLATEKPARLPVETPTAVIKDIAGHWAEGAIRQMAAAGVVSGYPDGTFNPDGIITRAEAVTLLLNLSGGTLSRKDIAIGDVGPEHWAYRQVVTAVEAGLVALSAEKLFGPDLAFSRSDLARSVSAMYTLSPSLRYTELVGKLIVKKGKVTLAVGGGVPREITGKVSVGAGADVKTYGDGQAEIIFDDGSGILIEANTAISFTRGIGFNYMRRDGSSGVAVDKLVLNLKKGKIFGLLASRYEKPRQPAPANKTSCPGGVAGSSVLLASDGLPPDIFQLLLAQAEAGSEESQETAWWAEPYTKRERVEVDMPWGVAGIRGSSWMNVISDREQTTAVLTGEGTFSAGGTTATVNAGESSTVSSAGATPITTPMSQAQAQEFVTASGFFNERAQEATNNVPEPPAPAIQSADAAAQQQQSQGQQQQQPQNPTSISNIISQALTTATTTTTITTTVNTGTSSGGGGGSGVQPEEHATLPPGNLSNDLSKTFNGGNIVVTIPAGVTIGNGAGVTARALSAPPAQPSGAQVAGIIADINITGVPAGTPIGISLKAIPGKNKVGIYHYNQNAGSWEYVDSSLDSSTVFVSAQVNHFSTYAVLEDTTPPSAVSSDPADDGIDVPVGKTMTITFSEIIQPGSSFQSINLREQNNRAPGIEVRASGNQLTVTPKETLACGGSYTLDIPPGAVADRFGNELAESCLVNFKTILPNVNLQSLVIKPGTLTPDFEGSITDYSAIIPNSVESITVTPITARPGATVTVNGMAVAGGSPSAPINLAIGDNIITVVVTGLDGKTTRTYTITATRSGRAALAGINVRPGTLKPDFDSDTYDYTVDVDYDVESIIVTSIAEDSRSTIKVNNEAVASGMPSTPINLNIGENIITIKVTALDKTARTYTVTVTRTGSAALVSLSLSAGDLSPDFNAATTSYTVTVDINVTSITVTPTAADPQATITLNGTAVP
ncbi:MAG: cadherin-like beta sandwich domain-containing protein, partial [Firmicutes bacterium]|nr:cadherin-like beta sandwich domain-containing protein [Bacillota bacterium]